MDESLDSEQIKVLFVDDEENILRALTRLMMAEDIDVLTANSGEQGLEVINSTENIGVIVSDQRMPGMSGAEFLEKAKEVVPDTVRIVLTGYADINATMDAINKGGAYRYVTKPWDDEEIVQLVKDALGRYSLIAENKRLNSLIEQKNDELKEWNSNLKRRVIDQTGDIRKKTEELAETNKQLKKNFENTILIFSSLIELRDKDVTDHSKNVSDLSVNVAEKLGLDDMNVQEIRTAALLHDVGKIGISDKVLLKDDIAMTSEEREEYMLHSVRGQAAIDTIKDLRGVGVLIRHHHECFDGSGFPDNKKETEIPLGARIIAVADFIDRTVKRIQGENIIELALSRVFEQLGKKFDPDLYQPFRELTASTYDSGADFLKSRGMVEREVEPSELKEGMIVMRDVFSGTGLLLISKETNIDETAIKGLKRYYRIDPPTEPILVLTQL